MLYTRMQTELVLSQAQHPRNQPDIYTTIITRGGGEQNSTILFYKQNIFLLFSIFQCAPHQESEDANEKKNLKSRHCFTIAFRHVVISVVTLLTRGSVNMS